jgi:hypothetical protein
MPSQRRFFAFRNAAHQDGFFSFEPKKKRVKSVEKGHGGRNLRHSQFSLFQESMLRCLSNSKKEIFGNLGKF